MIQWSIQNNLEDPATVVAVTPRPGYSTFSGLQAGDTIGPAPAAR
ncbi:hypothetical protein [Dactylosporangium sp. CA-139066]